MKILLVGDSFAADWTVKYKSNRGWPNLLAANFDVTNLAQAGCSEYKIWLQLSSQSLQNFSHIIIAHTSPYRIPVTSNPLHSDDPLHHSCDLIYTDIIGSDRKKKMASVIEFFEKYFDIEYARFVHDLIIQKQVSIIPSDCKVLHVTNLEHDIYMEKYDLMSFNDLFVSNRGTMNHFDDAGNQIVFEKISSWIKS